MTLCAARDCAMDAAWKVDGLPLCERHARQRSADRRHPTLARFEKIAVPNDQEVPDGE